MITGPLLELDFFPPGYFKAPIYSSVYTLVSKVVLNVVSVREYKLLLLGTRSPLMRHDFASCTVFYSRTQTMNSRGTYSYGCCSLTGFSTALRIEI